MDYKSVKPKNHHIVLITDPQGNLYLAGRLSEVTLPEYTWYFSYEWVE